MRHHRRTLHIGLPLLLLVISDCAAIHNTVNNATARARDGCDVGNLSFTVLGCPVGTAIGFTAGALYGATQDIKDAITPTNPSINDNTPSQSDNTGKTRESAADHP